MPFSGLPLTFAQGTNEADPEISIVSFINPAKSTFLITGFILSIFCIS
jgi:hypothetical protein